MENKRIYTFEKTLSANGNDTDNLVENDTTGKDGPFKNILINNGAGTADIRVYFNGQSNGIRINAGTIFPFENERVTSVRFQNLSSSVVANFEYTVDNKFTQLELLKGLALGFSEVNK